MWITTILSQQWSGTSLQRKLVAAISSGKLFGGNIIDSSAAPVLVGQVNGLELILVSSQSTCKWYECFLPDLQLPSSWRASRSLVGKVLPKPHGLMGAALISVSYSPQPDTSLHCEATNTGLVYRAACLFTPQLSPVPSYTAWWQRNIGVRNLPKVFTPCCPAETRTCDLLIASPTLYCDATTPHGP